MFSSISKAVAHVWSNSLPKETSSSESPNTKPESRKGTAPTYPCYGSSYDGDVQPQYGQDVAPGNAQADHTKSVLFQVGDEEDDPYKNGAEQSETKSTISGKITHVYSDYGLIDNSIHFRFDSVLYNMTPKVGLRAEATIESGGHQDVGLRATEVIISKADWEDDENGAEEPEWHIGKVTKTERTSGWMDETMFYDQDACPYGFIPHRGDWLVAEMTKNIETGAKVVKTVRPLREKRFKGFVTQVYPGYGFIDGTIYFSRKACDPNYVPKRDDEVEGKAIESDQSKGKWRAVTVSLKKQERMIHGKQFPANIFRDGEKMTKDNSIAVTVSGDFNNMCIGQEKNVTVYVRNTGEGTRKLIKSEAVCLLSDIILSIDGVAEDAVKKSTGLSSCNQSIEVTSGSKISLTVTITARSVGKSACQIVLTFDSSSISRPIPITVKEATNTLLTSGRLSGKEKWMMEHAMVSSGRGPAVLPGVRPARTSNPNLPVKLGMYPVGKRLKECYAEKRDVTEICPQLKQSLRPDNYFTIFSALLHIEELKMEVDMREFDLERASMRPRGEFLSLEVPGLAEGRPSVLVGDKVILTEPYASPNAPRFEGIVHEVHNEDIFLKFHPHFQESYGAEIFSVMFTFSRTPLRRCHQVVEMAALILGKEVLFPIELKAKSPQVEVYFSTIQRSVVYPGRPRIVIKLPTPKNIPRPLSSEGSPTKEPLRSQSPIKSIIVNASGSTETIASQDVRLVRKPSEAAKDSEKPTFLVPNALLDGVATTQDVTERGEGDDKAEFFNNKLNARQRSAVMRILKGEGRPTPYILFGPPGTGKTITIVETILQIHKHVPSSRILACTPSNSAADLLAERLHQSGAVKKVDMVRLNSFRRSDMNIPECIHQYCSNGEELRAVGHHRIIISTCSTGGQFYSLGLKPGHFSHVIVDEAGQATEPETLIGIGQSAGLDGQIVLAGDPMQLGPVLASSQAGELGLEQSLLERLMKRDLYQRDAKTFRDHGGYNPLLVTKLVDNYRSHPALLKLPSKCFYHDELNACANIEMRELACGWNQLPNKNGFPVIFHGIQGADLKEGNSPSWCNPAEAVQAVTYLQDLLSCSECHFRESDIGIITPYRKQVDKMNLLLDSVDILDTKVGSVEEFQGQERLVIIISTVRSSASLMNFDIRHQLGFLSNPKRFNVAITRPQALLIVVGNPHLLVNDYHWRALLKYCLKNGAYVGCEPPTEDTIKSFDDPQAEEKEETERENKGLEGSVQDVPKKEHPFRLKEGFPVEPQVQVTLSVETNQQVPVDSFERQGGKVKQDDASSPVARISPDQKADDGGVILHMNLTPERTNDGRPEAMNSSDTVGVVPVCSTPILKAEHGEKGEVKVGKEKEGTEIWDVYDSDDPEVMSSKPWCPIEEDCPNLDGFTAPSRGWYDATGDPLPDLVMDSDSSSGNAKRLQEIYPSNTINPEKSDVPGVVPCMPLEGLCYDRDKGMNGKTSSAEEHSARTDSSTHVLDQSSDGVSPGERKELVLQKRTQPDEQVPDKTATASSIFGGAKPVDTAFRERDNVVSQKRTQQVEQVPDKTATTSSIFGGAKPVDAAFRERDNAEVMKSGTKHLRLEQSGVHVRQYSDRSNGRERGNSHSSSGSDREWSRPRTWKRDSERSKQEEVFYQDKRSSVSPHQTSGGIKQQRDVKSIQSQRAWNSKRDKSSDSWSDGGLNTSENEWDKKVTDPAARQSSSFESSSRQYKKLTSDQQGIESKWLEPQKSRPRACESSSWRKDSARSNSQEELRKGYQASVSPHQTSGSIKQQRDVKAIQSQRAWNSKRDKSSESWSDGGWSTSENEWDSKATDPAPKKGSSPQKSPSPINQGGQRWSERQKTSTSSPMDKVPSGVRDQGNSVSGQSSVSNKNSDSDEETGEDFTASSWASGHQERNPEKRKLSVNSEMKPKDKVYAIPVSVHSSSNDSHESCTRTTSIEDLGSSRVQSPQCLTSSDNVKGTKDFVNM
nr:RNA helicase Mov10l1-like [Lytechinus pictus]XP_054752211.1 RNA helicase Mov10l1-like [Lytechinus pictus]